MAPEAVRWAVGGGFQKRLGAVTVGDKCHWSWDVASGRQWLGIGWAPFWGGGGDTSPPFQCIPGVQGRTPKLWVSK